MIFNVNTFVSKRGAKPPSLKRYINQQNFQCLINYTLCDIEESCVFLCLIKTFLHSFRRCKTQIPSDNQGVKMPQRRMYLHNDLQELAARDIYAVQLLEFRRLSFQSPKIPRLMS